jgi:hypothetical protein
VPWLTQLLAGFSAISGLAGVWLGQHIARGIAQKQWVRDQKLRIYSDILRAINDYAVWLADFSENMKFGTDGQTLTKTSAEIAEEFHAAYAVAPIFLTASTLETLEKIKYVFFSHSSMDPDPYGEGADKSLKLLKEASRALTISAREDLASSNLPT